MDRKTDTEQLIAAIKQHEAIWNKNTKEYHRKISKEVAWNEVCEELVKGWNDLNEEEKTHRQGELKKRWNNIRDYFKKDLALQVNGSKVASMKKNKYMFSKQLAFLRPVLAQTRTSTYVKAASDDETEEIYLEDNFSSDSETSHLLKRKHAINLLEENTDHTEDVSNVARSTEVVEEDSDLLFLKSLLPDMKMMNYSQKIDFKMGILKLHKRIMLSSEDDEEDCKNPLK